MKRRTGKKWNEKRRRFGAWPWLATAAVLCLALPGVIGGTRAIDVGPNGEPPFPWGPLVINVNATATPTDWPDLALQTPEIPGWSDVPLEASSEEPDDTGAPEHFYTPGNPEPGQTPDETLLPAQTPAPEPSDAPQNPDETPVPAQTPAPEPSDAPQNPGETPVPAQTPAPEPSDAPQNPGETLLPAQTPAPEPSDAPQNPGETLLPAQTPAPESSDAPQNPGETAFPAQTPAPTPSGESSQHAGEAPASSADPSPDQSPLPESTPLAPAAGSVQSVLKLAEPPETVEDAVREPVDDGAEPEILLFPEGVKAYGSDTLIRISSEQAQQILADLEQTTPDERKAVLLTARSLIGRVSYFWGGKSAAIGWDRRWGNAATVDGESGSMRTYGLDCSGFVTWVFNNAAQRGVKELIGNGSSNQWGRSSEIPWQDAQIGDLAFKCAPGEEQFNHVGIVTGWTSSGDLLITHCTARGGVVETSAYDGGFRHLRSPAIFADAAFCADAAAYFKRL